MNIDAILQTLYQYQVNYILIGGVNFLINHQPVLTYDVDVWVEDVEENLVCLNRALVEMDAAWGSTEESWDLIPSDYRWLQQQVVFCLTTKYAALDIFREVKGLEGKFTECRSKAGMTQTSTGIPFASLSDEHMLQCQLALPVEIRKESRVIVLQKALNRNEIR